MDSPILNLASQHQMWLDDPVTQALRNHLSNLVKNKTEQVIGIRITNPSQLPDYVADLALAIAMKSTIETGKFLN